MDAKEGDTVRWISSIDKIERIGLVVRKLPCKSKREPRPSKHWYSIVKSTTPIISLELAPSSAIKEIIEAS